MRLDIDAYRDDITIEASQLSVFDRATRKMYPSTRRFPITVPRGTKTIERVDFDVSTADGAVSRELDVVLGEEHVEIKKL